MPFMSPDVDRSAVPAASGFVGRAEVTAFACPFRVVAAVVQERRHRARLRWRRIADVTDQVGRGHDWGWATGSGLFAKTTHSGRQGWSTDSCQTMDESTLDCRQRLHGIDREVHGDVRIPART